MEHDAERERERESERERKRERERERRRRKCAGFRSGCNFQVFCTYILRLD